MSDENQNSVSANEFFAQNNKTNDFIKSASDTNMDKFPNMSGKGDEYPVPDIIAKKFNWGAFFLTWVWGIFNKSYITFLTFAACLIPFVGIIINLGLQIWFGIKGNQWAWQHKHFESLDDFHKYQKKWAIAGIIVASIAIILSIMYFAVLINMINQFASN